MISRPQKARRGRVYSTHDVPVSRSGATAARGRFGRLERWLRDSEVDVFHVLAGIAWEGQPEARVT